MSEKRCLGCMLIKQNSPLCEHCGYDERKPNAPHQLPPGTVLNNQYIVGRVLGQGGFGITYMGWDEFLDIPVAIKEFYPSGIVTRDAIRSYSVFLISENMSRQFVSNRDRFVREATSLAKLGRSRGASNIVRVQNLVLANSTAYIIMEYVDGIDMRQYMRQKGGILTLEQTLRLLLPLMESLEKVHESHIVHRDISPDNIMVLPDGSTKLIDFGAAHEVHQDEDGIQKSTEAILKYGFAPPEQYQRKGSLGPWTDVYALCATIYYCTTGKLPPNATDRFMGDEDFEWETIPGISEGMILALRNGTAIRKDERTQSMGQLRFALESSSGAQVDNLLPKLADPAEALAPKQAIPATAPVEEALAPAPESVIPSTAPVEEPLTYVQEPVIPATAPVEEPMNPVQEPGIPATVPVEEPELPVEEPIIPVTVPVEEPMEPAEEPVEVEKEPTESEEELIEVVEEPAEPEEEAIEIVEEPAEPEEEAIEIVEEPEEPEAEPEEPVEESVEVEEESTEPEEEPCEIVEEPIEVVEEPVEVVEEPVEVVEEPTESEEEPVEVVEEPVEVVEEPVEVVEEPAEPVEEPMEPAEEPVEVVEEPVEVVEEPIKAVEEDPQPEAVLPIRKRRPVWPIALAAIAAAALVAVLGIKLLRSPEKATVSQPPVPATVPTEVAEPTLSEEERANLEAYHQAELLAEAGKHAQAGIAFAKLGDYEDARERSFEQWRFTRKPNVLAQNYHYQHDYYTIGVKNDGTVQTYGSNFFKMQEAANWQDISEVFRFNGFAIGVKTDGSVVTDGLYEDISVTRNHDTWNIDYPRMAQTIRQWTDIETIRTDSSGDHRILGLKKDGTLVTAAATESKKDLSPLETWRDIVDVHSSSSITYKNAKGNIVYRTDGTHGIIGLRTDGTLVTWNAPKELEQWEDVIALDFNAKNHIRGLCADGTVYILMGEESEGEITWTYSGKIPGWEDIVDIANVVGLHEDGTVSVFPEDAEYFYFNSWSDSGNALWEDSVKDWSNVTELYGLGNTVLGLRSNGTVAVSGRSDNWTDVLELSDLAYLGPDGSHVPNGLAFYALRKDGSIAMSDWVPLPHELELKTWTDIRIPFSSAAAPDPQPQSQESTATVPTVGPDAWKDNVLMHPYNGVDFNGSYVDRQKYIGLTVFRSTIRNNQIRSVTFLDTLADEPEDSWDASAGEDGSVKAWAVKNSTNESLYDLYIAAEGGINGTQATRKMFIFFEKLEQIHFGNAFHTDEATDMTGMFFGCTTLTQLDLTGLNTANVTSMSQMFVGCNNLAALDISSFDTSKVTNMSAMFSLGDGSYSALTQLDVSNFDTSNVTNMGSMFQGCAGLTKLDVSSFDTSNVTDMANMFYGCKNLTNLDLSGLDTAKVESMNSMFVYCESLKDLDVSSFDTARVTGFDNMFKSCRSLTGLDLSSFDTANVSTMEGMFWGCESLTALDVCGFNTTHVTNMRRMFKNCRNLTDLDLSGFRFANILTTEMFTDCTSLQDVNHPDFNTLLP